MHEFLKIMIIFKYFFRIYSAIIDKYLYKNLYLNLLMFKLTPSKLPKQFLTVNMNAQFISNLNNINYCDSDE